MKYNSAPHPTRCHVCPGHDDAVQHLRHKGLGKPHVEPDGTHATRAAHPFRTSTCCRETTGAFLSWISTGWTHATQWLCAARFRLSTNVCGLRALSRVCHQTRSSSGERRARTWRGCRRRESSGRGAEHQAWVVLSWSAFEDELDAAELNYFRRTFRKILPGWNALEFHFFGWKKSSKFFQKFFKKFQKISKKIEKISKNFKKISKNFNFLKKNPIFLIFHLLHGDVIFCLNHPDVRSTFFQKLF